MKLYCRTVVGKRATSDRSGDGEELKVLDYFADNRTATDDQLDTVADRYVIRDMLGKGLIKELTT